MVSLNKKTGFTLVELLVAISIIAVLTAVLLPNFMGARERAKDANKKQDLYSMKTALRSFYNDHQAYPDSGGGWVNNYDASRIGTTIAQYMPGVTGVGYTYEYMGVGDSFFLRVRTDVNNTDENASSQLKCGVGTTVSGYFYVCAF